MMYSVYFSPTGGTKKAADLLAAAWKEVEKTVEIDLCEQEDFTKYTFNKEDVVLVSVPSYGGLVPETAAVRLQELTGNGARAVLNVVYGNRDYDDTLLQLKDILTDRGFLPWAAVTAIAKHSIVAELAADRPDAADAEELKAFGAKIKESLAEAWNGEAPNGELLVKGNHPYKEYKKNAMKPMAGDGCTGCGLCAQKCPVGAISKENPKETDPEICISCMRCLAICPVKARTLNEQMLAAVTERLMNACAARKENTCVIVER